jgi:hypothetical protein
MIYIIISLSCVLILSVILNIVQLKRQEKYEEYIADLESSNVEYYTFFSKLKQITSDANSKLRAIDRRGAFQADDEIGWVFKEIQSIVDMLNKGF